MLTKYPPRPLVINHFLKVITKTPHYVLSSPEEIKDIAMHTTTKLSAGFDNVSIEIIKLSIKYIAEPLSHLVNNSFMSGLIPDFLKIARVCPYLKAVTMLILLSTGQYLFCKASLKYLKKLSITALKLFISALYAIC